MGAAPQPHVMPVVELLYCLRQAAEVARGSWFLGAPVSERAGEGAWCSWFLGDWVSEATKMARARGGRVLFYWRSDRRAEETVTSSLFLGAPMRRERKEERSSLPRLLRGALGTKRGEDPRDSMVPVEAMQMALGMTSW